MEIALIKVWTTFSSFIKQIYVMFIFFEVFLDTNVIAGKAHLRSEITLLLYMKFSRHINFKILRFTYFATLKFHYFAKILRFESLLF